MNQGHNQRNIWGELGGRFPLILGLFLYVGFYHWNGFILGFWTRQTPLHTPMR